MATHGITLTQIAKYLAMISTGRFDKLREIDQGGFYERFCAAQEFEELINENISTNINKSIAVIDYVEWKRKIHAAQRSSTPLIGSRGSEMLVVPFQKENAALFMLMGYRIIESEQDIEEEQENILDDTVSFTKPEARDYCEWNNGYEQVQRSSTPLIGSRESEVLFLPFENENAALFILMGNRFIEWEY